MVNNCYHFYVIIFPCAALGWSTVSYCTAAYNAASWRTFSTWDDALQSEWEYRYIRGKKKASLGKEGKGHKEQGNGGKENRSRTEEGEMDEERKKGRGRGNVQRREKIVQRGVEGMENIGNCKKWKRSLYPKQRNARKSLNS